MGNIDAVLGLGRVMAEAIAARKIAILCSNFGLRGVVNENNFSFFARDNFCGIKGSNKKISEVVAEIENIELIGLDKVFTLCFNNNEVGIKTQELEETYKEVINNFTNNGDLNILPLLDGLGRNHRKIMKLQREIEGICNSLSWKLVNKIKLPISFSKNVVKKLIK